MKLLLNILVTAGLTLLIARLMPGIYVTGFMIALVIAVLLRLLNLGVKPFLWWWLFLFPVHLLKFKSRGYFVLALIAVLMMAVDAVILLLFTKYLTGFIAGSFWSAFFFSIFLYISESVADFVLSFLWSVICMIFKLGKYQK